MDQSQSVSQSFLPDFCDRRNAVAVIVFAELFALCLVLAHPSSDRWQVLVRTSLFILWIAFGNALALCLVRRRLSRMAPAAAGFVSYGVSVFVTLAVSILALLVEGAVLGGSVEGVDVFSFLLSNVAISAIVSAVALRYFYVQHQWRRNTVLEAQARFEALQARIRPHFLFNSMNTIAALTRSQPEVAEKTVEDLAELFRISLGKERSFSLEEELELTRRYLGIESLRLGERLRLEWTLQADLPLNAKVPALILQPLVENAIYHGIEPNMEGGTVSIIAERRGSSLWFSVQNPLPPPYAKRRSGNQMAQENVRQRLILAYGDSARLDLDSADGAYRASITIPFQESA